MKVLWFTNIVMPAFARANGGAALNQNGWLSALAEAIRSFAPEIDLTIAFAGSTRGDITIDGIRYVSLKDSRRQLGDEVSRCVREMNPDIIHVHGSEGRFALMPKSVFSNVPTAVSLQGVISGCVPHYVGALQPCELRGCLNPINFALTRYSVFRGGRCWKRHAKQEAEALFSFRYIFGRTRWDEAWARALAPKARYYHVGEVLRAPFYGANRDWSLVCPHTIYSGAATTYPLKGAHWLFRAVQIIRQRYPDVRLRIANGIKVRPPVNLKEWLLQGEYHRYLSKLIVKLDLNDCVDLLPSLTADEVAEELRRAEVFCLPSLCENSPNSLGEAMLMGVPCVATFTGGTSSVAKDGENCRLVPSADPAALAAAVIDYFKDERVAAEHGRRAREFALERYEPKCVVEQLVAAYEDMMEQ